MLVLVLCLIFLPFILIGLYLIIGILNKKLILCQEFNYLFIEMEVNFKNIKIFYDLKGTDFITLNYFFSKIIIIPHKAKEYMTSQQINALLRHEIGHIKLFHLEKTFILWAFMCILQVFLTKITLERLNYIYAIIVFFAFFSTFKFIQDRLRKQFEREANYFSGTYDINSLNEAFRLLKKMKYETKQNNINTRQC